MESKRFVSVDIIKGIAMIMVILVHYQQSFGICKWFDYLQMGCPIFFVAWTFLQSIDLIAGKFGFDIHNYFCLFAFIPVVLALSYFGGSVMRIIVKYITSIGRQKTNV